MLKRFASTFIYTLLIASAALISGGVMMATVSCKPAPATSSEPKLDYVRGEGYMPVTENWVLIGNQWIGKSLYSRHELRTGNTVEVRYFRLEGQMWLNVPKNENIAWGK